MSYICQTCRRTREQLVKENKLNLVQGYEQCGYDNADLEHESVVLRSDLLEEARAVAISRNDVTVLPITDRSRAIAKALNIEPREDRVPNINKYLPEWYRKELHERFEKSKVLARSMSDRYKDYNDIID